MFIFDFTEKMITLKLLCLFQLTSRQVVDAYIERQREVQPIINAITEDRWLLARAEAELVDRALEELQKGAESMPSADSNKPFRTATLATDWPLLGIPISVKECFAVAGLYWTGGIKSRAERRVTATVDDEADTVRRLKGAGAIVLCHTNVPELAMWTESSNVVYGRTLNPYDTRRAPGGSSGGEAALVCISNYQ